MQKYIFRYINIISGIVFISGLLICIILADDKEWPNESISYLGSKSRCTLFFGIWLLSISIINFMFLISTFTYLIKKYVDKTRIESFLGTATIGFFVFSYISIIVAGFTTSIEYYAIHYFCGYFFFLYYPLGISLFGARFSLQFKNLALLSCILVITYFIGSARLMKLYPNYMPVELFAISLISIWNIALNKIVLSLK